MSPWGKKHRAKQQYIFIDESGKPEIFSSKGSNLVVEGKATKYLILAAIRTSDQLKLQEKVTEFKLGLLRNPDLSKKFSSAYSLDSFHAHNDYTEVRNLFYKFIEQVDDIKIDVLVIEKLKCLEFLQRNPGKMYGVMSGHLLSDLCHQCDSTEIIFSRQDSSHNTRAEIETEVSRLRIEFLKSHPSLTTTFSLSYFHNPHYSHSGLQIADYVAYAVFQYYEKGNRQYYDLIKNKIGHIGDVCNKKYHTRSNPL